MRKNIFSKITAIITATVLIALSGILSANAAVIDEGFESVTKDYKTKGYKKNISYYSVSAKNLPSAYSSIDLGYVTEIKSQVYNDCWAYAGLATFESKLLKSGFDIQSMSVDHLNVWATRRSNGKGWQRSRSGDGYTYISAGYLSAWQGGVAQDDVDFIDFGSASPKLFGDDMPTNLTKYGTTAIKYLTSYDTDEIKQSIIDNGGVFTSYATTSSCYGSNNTAYFMPQSYEGGYTGHSIEIVGWDDNYSKYNFNGPINVKPNNNGAWLVRNSWGNYNSLGGYFWISYEDKYIFGSKYDPSFTIEQVTEIDDKTKLLQNEIYGATYSFGYEKSNVITYINRFDFNKNFRTLDKVIFETKTAGADYSIYYIPILNNTPANDMSAWTLLDSGIVEYDGYICCDIEDFEVPDTDGSIGIKIDTSAINKNFKQTDTGYVQNNIGVGEWLIKTDKTLSFLNESEKGESYIYINDSMTDIMDWYETNNDDTIGGTFVIKAIVKENEVLPTLIGDVNLDGIVNVVDATAIQKHIADLQILDGVALANADFNGDKTIDISDVTSLQKSIVNQ